MDRRKLFREYAERNQRKIVEETFNQEVEQEMEILKSLSEETQNLNEEPNLGCDSAKQKSKINEKPLFGKNFETEESPAHNRTNDVEEYIEEIMFEKFRENFCLSANLEHQIFEDLEYSYSDSESDIDSDGDESDFELEDELRRIGKNMNREDLDDLLKVLQRAGHKDLLSTARKLLNTPRSTDVVPCLSGQYFHYGLKQCLLDILNRGEGLPATIYIDIGIDGVPLSKSGNTKIWPIVGRVQNRKRLPPFLVGCYYGTSNPTSAESLLRPFVDEFKNLQNKGITLKEEEYKIILRCIICDTPARCLVRGTQMYNGYYGCCRCEVHGDWRKKTVFLEETRDQTH